MSETSKEGRLVNDRECVSALLRSFKIIGIKPIILVDLDGVVFDWSGFVRGELHEILPPDQHKTHEQIHSFYLEDVYPGKEAARQIKRITQKAGLYSSLKPIEGSVEAVKKLGELGYNVFFCTAPETEYQDQMCWSEKAQAIESHFGEAWVRKLILTKDKTLVQGTILVDDKPPLQIKGIVPPTWIQLLFDQPYNQTMARETTWRGRWNDLFDVLGETL
jgi:5'-nucleotidase